jgi:hypothetical protein
MDRDAARARASFTGQLVTHLAAGMPWRAILQLATDLDADVIVVGSHRKGTVARWVLGAVSEQVVRKASCAVLVARPKDYHSAVPEIEPPCAECVATQRQTSARSSGAANTITRGSICDVTSITSCRKRSRSAPNSFGRTDDHPLRCRCARCELRSIEVVAAAQRSGSEIRGDRRIVGVVSAGALASVRP